MQKRFDELTIDEFRTRMIEAGQELTDQLDIYAHEIVNQDLKKALETNFQHSCCALTRHVMAMVIAQLMHGHPLNISPEDVRFLLQANKAGWN
jgi:hypothetical protein